MNVLNNGLQLCKTFNININYDRNLNSFKNYVKS